MASIENRSRYVVSVKNRNDLTKEFPYSDARRAREYLKQLRGDGLKPKITQLSDNLLVRFRNKGQPPQAIKATSREDAEAVIGRVESDQHHGLFIDYTRAHRVTLAKLFEDYVRDVCPLHKGCDVETWTLNGFIADSKNELQEAIRERNDLRSAGVTDVPRIRATREPRNCVEWVQKPLARIEPIDINKYVVDRIEQGMKPATVDRELDLISQVIS